jgi:hypothetical protein
MGAIRPTTLIFEVGQNAIVIGAVKQKVRLAGRTDQGPRCFRLVPASPGDA